MRKTTLLCLTLACALAAADEPRAARSGVRFEGDRVIFENGARLPQDHEYQVVLRTFMATLTVEDFDHGIEHPVTLEETPDHPDPEVRYRNFIMTLMHQPFIGGRRGYSPAVNYPAELFTLDRIETRGNEIVFPIFGPCALMSFTHWNYPGNTLYDSRALKLRAFVNGAVLMMMSDLYLDLNPAILTERPDRQHAYQLIRFGFPFEGFKDVLPPEVQRGYAVGMERYARRILDLGILGEDASLDLMAAAALWYAYDVTEDKDLMEAIEKRIRTLFSDPQCFHPAGYFVERGGMDLGFGGVADNFAIWSALKSNRDFANEAVERIYRLRAHLTLPEPDGSSSGPAHFNNRLGSPASAGQWPWGLARDTAASMVTDEALHWVHPLEMRHPSYPRPPDPDKTDDDILAEAGMEQARRFNGQMRDNPRVNREDGTHTLSNEEFQNEAFRFRMWYNWHYPLTLNYGYDHYRPGSWARRASLIASGSRMLNNPFERGEIFVRDFAGAFYVANQLGYRAIVHTGPVGRHVPGEKKHRFPGPLGFGGGQLSAFSTVDAGAVLLGRRSGQSFGDRRDRIEEWRTWPLHAVSGVTGDGRVFSSARIVDPAVTAKVTDQGGTITAGGELVVMTTRKDPDAADPATAREIHVDEKLDGVIGYSRTFVLTPENVRVQTVLNGDGKDTVAELYETLPVFHRNDHRHEGTETVIEFLVGTTWQTATVEPVKNAAAIRLKRFTGTVEIRFDKTRTVKLAPSAWNDDFLSRALCRAILVDLLETGGKPVAVKGEKTIAYTIRAL